MPLNNTEIKMASTLGNKQLNFARVAIVCLDIIKLPLIDILDLKIKAEKLFDRIRSSESLMTGRYQLYLKEKEKCFIKPPNLPDYNQFDVSLLYKLIRNLCPSLKPGKGWGRKPNDKDTEPGDDIERIRLFRNEAFAHADTAELDDGEFQEIWTDIERVLSRLHSFTSKKGCKSEDYGEKLQKVKGMTTENKECNAVIPKIKDDLKRLKEDITSALKDKIQTMNDNHESLDIQVQTYERTPEESELKEAGTRIGASFPLLGAVLDLGSSEIDRLKTDKQSSSRAKIGTMLVSWKNKHSHHATIGKLIEAVEKTCPETDIDDFKKFFKI